MKIKLLKPFGFSEAGDILDPDPPVAHLLIERGVAVAFAPTPKAAVSFGRNKAIKSSHTRGKHVFAQPAD